MRFTAIVVTWNSAAEIPGLVESVARHLGERCELLFVDNHSTDGTVDAIGSVAPASRVISLPQNIGFGRACNVGVRAAQSEVVCLLNPDSVVVDDSLHALAELAATERALFAPLLLNEDGTPQISARPPLGGWEAILLSFWPGRLMPGRLRRRCEPWRYEERLSVGWVSGACVVARTDVLLELGPFDEELFLYGEDADLSLRAWRAGVPVVSAGDLARVVHLGGRSGARAFGDTGMQRKVEARWWVVRKRLGAHRAALDLTAQCLGHSTRWIAKRLLGRDAAVHALWLGAAVKAVTARRRSAG